QRVTGDDDQCVRRLGVDLLVGDLQVLRQELDDLGLEYRHRLRVQRLALPVYLPEPVLRAEAGLELQLGENQAAGEHGTPPGVVAARRHRHQRGAGVEPGRVDLLPLGQRRLRIQPDRVALLVPELLLRVLAQGRLRRDAGRQRAAAGDEGELVVAAEPGDRDGLAGQLDLRGVGALGPVALVGPGVAVRVVGRVAFPRGIGVAHRRVVRGRREGPGSVRGTDAGRAVIAGLAVAQVRGTAVGSCELIRARDDVEETGPAGALRRVEIARRVRSGHRTAAQGVDAGDDGRGHAGPADLSPAADPEGVVDGNPGLRIGDRGHVVVGPLLAARVGLPPWLRPESGAARPGAGPDDLVPAPLVRRRQQRRAAYGDHLRVRGRP